MQSQMKVIRADLCPTKPDARILNIGDTRVSVEVTLTSTKPMPPEKVSRCVGAANRKVTSAWRRRGTRTCAKRGPRRSSVRVQGGLRRQQRLLCGRDRRGERRQGSVRSGQGHLRSRQGYLRPRQLPPRRDPGRRGAPGASAEEDGQILHGEAAAGDRERERGRTRASGRSSRTSPRKSMKRSNPTPRPRPPRRPGGSTATSSRACGSGSTRCPRRSRR